MEAQSSPIASPTYKRPRAIDDEGDGDNNGDATSDENPSGSTLPVTIVPQTISATLNKNLLAISKKYVQKKKLQSDRLLEVDTFLCVSSFLMSV
jgi:hypothetical protein